jgi:hypothetical protein
MPCKISDAETTRDVQGFRPDDVEAMLEAATVTHGANDDMVVATVIQQIVEQHPTAVSVTPLRAPPARVPQSQEEPMSSVDCDAASVTSTLETCAEVEIVPICVTAPAFVTVANVPAEPLIPKPRLTAAAQRRASAQFRTESASLSTERLLRWCTRLRTRSLSSFSSLIPKLGK